MRSALQALQLTDYRSYAVAELRPDGRSVFLFGPNGAGKTNLLEAISLLSPGRGLRGAPLAEVEIAAYDLGSWATHGMTQGARSMEQATAATVGGGGARRGALPRR